MSVYEDVIAEEAGGYGKKEMEAGIEGDNQEKWTTVVPRWKHKENKKRMCRL